MKPEGKWQLLAVTHGPDSLEAWARRYLEYGEVHNYSPSTLHTRYLDLSTFSRWCHERGLASPREITKPILERYQRHLYYYRKTNGQPLSASRQHVLVVHVKGFFRWLVRHNHLLTNPASELELPRLPQRRLRDPLSIEEVERILAVPDLSDPLALRDRVILEVLYSTGIRRSELAALKVTDVDSARGTVFVRQGKGRKDRFVPIGERALAWIQKYLDEVRPDLVVDPSEPHLFLGKDGRVLSVDQLTGRVREYFEKAGITKPGACHLFRHTMATLMLDNGADVRILQELLGHTKLDTTQIYTHVSIGKLKAVHAATHPGAKLERKPGAGETLAGDAPASRSRP
jgi:integrase/recombinase XerD